MNTRIVVWLAPLPLLACYSPHDDVSGGGDDAPGESSSEGSSGGSMSTSAATLTTSEASTSPSTTPGSTDPASSDDTAAETADSSDSGGNPFCGDGAIDDEEECDAGEANAFEAECRPDCTFNTCGDGYVWEGIEGCDDGEGDNVLEVGACAPDCSRVIVEKLLNGGEVLYNGDFGNNPVAFADSTCEPGYSAMFVVPGLREASASPYEGNNQLDWVLQPYTAYFMGAQLLWITDDSALLGVRSGRNQPLLAPIFNDSDFFWNERVVTGMDDDWTGINANTCNGWTSSSAAQMGSYGDPLSTTAYLNAGEQECDNWTDFVSPVTIDPTWFYCVEQ